MVFNSTRNTLNSKLHRRIATPSKPSLVGIGAAALMLCWAATSVSAGTGPGLAVKIGAQTLDGPIDGEKTTRVRMEAEVATALQADDRMDFFLSIPRLKTRCVPAGTSPTSITPTALTP